MLERWKLKSGDPKIYDLTNGVNKQIIEPLTSISFNQGIALKYPHIESSAIETVFGESCFGDEVNPEERYIQNIFLIAGKDYRIHPFNEMIDVTIVEPPANGSNQLIPYCDIDNSFHNLHAEAYDSTKETIAPKTKVTFYNKNNFRQPGNFYGFWRAALIFDFGKDLPKLEDDFYSIANRAFVEDIEKSFGAGLVEIGQIY